MERSKAVEREHGVIDNATVKNYMLCKLDWLSLAELILGICKFFETLVFTSSGVEWRFLRTFKGVVKGKCIAIIQLNITEKQIEKNYKI